jgi:hypothetical protein
MSTEENKDCASQEEVMVRLTDLLTRVSLRRAGNRLEVGFNANKVTAHCVVSLPYDSIESKVIRDWHTEATQTIGDATLLRLQKDKD